MFSPASRSARTTSTVIAPGFKTYEQKGIVLEVGSSIAINAGLSVGSSGDEGRGPMPKALRCRPRTRPSSRPSTSKRSDRNAAQRPPDDGSDHCSPAAPAPAPAGDFTGSKYSYQTISVSIAGGGGNTTLWRLDGGDNQDYMANGNLPYPFPDAVSEFSVESTDLGAQDGGHVGGMVNVVTQSGTNQYHGEAFEFIRNNYLDATNFFSSTPDTLHQNQFGGTFGGPIKRNKLFAFAAYQRTNGRPVASRARRPRCRRQRTWPAIVRPQTAFQASPAATRATQRHAPIQLVDPLTGTTLTGNKYASTPTYNAPALALQAYLPAINPALDPNNCGFVFYAIPYLLTDNQFVTRVDYTISPKHNLYGRYFIDGYQFPAYFDHEQHSHHHPVGQH